MTRKGASRLIAAIVLVALLANPDARAADAPAYPTKAVRVLSGYPPGGPADIMGRILTDHFAAALGQPFYIEPKPGAAGNLAGEILANSPPDGYTLYLAGLGNVAVNHELYGNMSYDPATAYAPISILAHFPVVLEVASLSLIHISEPTRPY